MQLTRHTDISLRVLMHLTLFPGEICTVKEIAEKYDVSRNHLVKVVHRLSSLGYLKSSKGRGGGVTLAKKPEAITVGEIVRQMEATLDVIDCRGTNCPLNPACLLKHALAESTQLFLENLDTYTIADITKNRSQILKLVAG